ncbi:MAG: saccharopine dehydrogenase C-terminal domain-containing protein [Pseudomonadota bacterium]
MKRIAVLGSGKIGALISGLLGNSGDYTVDLIDKDDVRAQHVSARHNLDSVRVFSIDATDEAALRAYAKAEQPVAMLSGLPYFCNEVVARVAAAEGAHYFDLTEDVKVTESVRSIATNAEQAFVPQCGLAPGFISIAANELIKHFDAIEMVKLRVGALPQNPNNILKYSLTWSTDGVINEYGNLCQSVVEGQITEVLPLEGLESIQIDGTSYEAFNTSGGLGSLAETHAGKVRNMDYKTIRYPGHCEIMRLLMNGLNLNSDRDTLKRILENSVPRTLQDVVIIYAAVKGTQNGQLREENYVSKVYPQLISGRLWSAIQVTTAAGICAVMDLVLANPGAYHGFVAQEQFSLGDILDNRFGAYYADGGSSDLSKDLVARGMTGH